MEITPAQHRAIEVLDSMMRKHCKNTNAFPLATICMMPNGSYNVIAIPEFEGNVRTFFAYVRQVPDWAIKANMFDTTAKDSTTVNDDKKEQ